ncbi:PREDICTED: E3 ubiquitin-protein ligase SDIR1-like isoform X2 [Nelumbo nucifera]|uniref:E3 ubiquitin-protein ligase SDIR1-like isoform X2 n=1 Tax=Nelumbo nucifera TaxID=4432 RepID=A0A1U8PXZ3_NELNU|nr:PREDICTED: E3 ubiquitin-protein ligase SDIR1-like isoform X2 [Nelumbo nucifera]
MNSRHLGSDYGNYSPFDHHWFWTSSIRRTIEFNVASAAEESRGELGQWPSDQERLRIRHRFIGYHPRQSLSPIPIDLLLSNEMAQGVNAQLVPQSQRMRIMDERSLQTPPQEYSRLTQEEKKKVVEKLRKEVYNPPRKTKPQLYYRNKSSISTELEEEDGEAKGCSICLEDFVLHEQVLITPCNHMFHGDCILPWVKSQGQCPVCRFMLYEPRRSTALPIINSRNIEIPAPATNDPIGANQLFALIRTMEEALDWPLGGHPH